MAIFTGSANRRSPTPVSSAVTCGLLAKPVRPLVHLCSSQQKPAGASRVLLRPRWKTFGPIERSPFLFLDSVYACDLFVPIIPTTACLSKRLPFCIAPASHADRSKARSVNALYKSERTRLLLHPLFDVVGRRIEIMQWVGELTGFMLE